jgi:hypothetical protein
MVLANVLDALRESGRGDAVEEGVFCSDSCESLSDMLFAHLGDKA